MDRPTLYALVKAFADTVKEAGQNGAPAGPMYAAAMQHGLSLNAFATIMEALIVSGKIRQINNVYYWR
jgi:hypothetical protein